MCMSIDCNGQQYRNNKILSLLFAIQIHLVGRTNECYKVICTCHCQALDESELRRPRFAYEFAMSLRVGRDVWSRNTIPWSCRTRRRMFVSKLSASMSSFSEWSSPILYKVKLTSLTSVGRFFIHLLLHSTMRSTNSTPCSRSEGGAPARLSSLNVAMSKTQQATMSIAEKGLMIDAASWQECWG